MPTTLRKMLLVFIALMLSVSVMGCVLNGIDLKDESNDDNYILVSIYYDVDVKTNEIVQKAYIPESAELVFYTLDEIQGELEHALTITEIHYQIKGNYRLLSRKPIKVYAIDEKSWVSIPESAWHYSQDKLQDDVLVTYGTKPLLLPTYEIGDVVRVIYQDNGLQLHFMIERAYQHYYIRYGDLRALLI